MCILNVGRSAGGEELCAVVYVGRPERNLSVVRNGAVGNGDDRGGGGNVPIVDSFYASSESVKVGPKPGDQGFGSMSEATAVIHEAAAVIEQCFRHPLTDIGLERFLKDWEKAQAARV